MHRLAGQNISHVALRVRGKPKATARGGYNRTAADAWCYLCAAAGRQPVHRAADVCEYLAQWAIERSRHVQSI